MIRAVYRAFGLSLQNFGSRHALAALLLAILGYHAISVAAAEGALTKPEGYLQTHCMENGYLVSYLNKAFGEIEIANAESEDGHPIQLYVSRKGSWTLVELLPDGSGCVNAAGQRMYIKSTPRPARKPAS